LNEHAEFCWGGKKGLTTMLEARIMVPGAKWIEEKNDSVLIFVLSLLWVLHLKIL
jgi:hypothetical protein